MENHNRSRRKDKIVFKVGLLRKQDRPTCRHCGGLLKPDYDIDFIHTSGAGYTSRRTFSGRYGYEGNGYFCSLRCGYNWAVIGLRLS